MCDRCDRTYARHGEMPIWCPRYQSCPDFCCDKPLKLQVCKSAAGYYIGTWCPKCGPYSRYSKDYYKTREEAQQLLDNDTWEDKTSN